MKDKLKGTYLEGYEDTKLDRDILCKFILLPEFVKGAEKVLENGDKLTDEMLYRIVKEVCFEKMKDRENNPDFDLQTAKDVMRNMAEILTGDRISWKAEYEEFSGFSAKGLGFLYKDTNIHYLVIRKLLLNQDFVNELTLLAKTKRKVTDADIYGVVMKLYFPMLKALGDPAFKNSFKAKFGAEEYKEFSHRRHDLKEAIKSISKCLNNGDSEAWRTEYDKYLVQ